MDLAHALALYDSEVRAHPQVQPGMAVERVGGVVRITGPFNFVSAWDLTDDTARAAVAEQAAHFRERGEDLLWRVHDYDQPSKLPGFLAEEGFTASETGTLMIFDLANVLEAPAADGVEVRRARTIDELDGFVTAAGLAFGQEEGWRRANYADRLDEDDLILLVAYVAGQAVASARLEMSAGWSFGLLQGGGVAPEHRRRGVYRALVAARAEHARARGLKYLVIDARETSRPILQNLGFVPAARATMWVLRP